MKKLHFIGIGGIGMSALASMCASMPDKFQVSGSDRGANNPENAKIIEPLKKQGIKIFAQDGSYINNSIPDLLIYSSAIEEDNADFIAGKNIQRLHRSKLIELLLNECHFECSIAVTGSSGKSTVCGYLAETLLNMNEDPNCLNGGLVKRFITESNAGNYRAGDGKYLVFEADESDKSLLNYSADYAIILNIGTDHYEAEELGRVFGEFANKIRKISFVGRDVYNLIKPYLNENSQIIVIDFEKHENSEYYLSDYRTVNKTETIYRNGKKSKLSKSLDRDQTDDMGIYNIMKIYGFMREDFRLVNSYPVAEFSDKYLLKLPQYGKHHAMNALFIFALLEKLGFEPDEILKGLESFTGIWRRNDFAGQNSSGVAVYDDYAHNPEKVAGCISAMREIYCGRIFAVFQPHGFKPFAFMRDELFIKVNSVMRKSDRFIILPPYYAGGTSSFSPSNSEVIAEWKSKAKHPEMFMDFQDRETLYDYLSLESKVDDVIIIMGARDNSLSDYAKSFCNND